MYQTQDSHPDKKSTNPHVDTSPLLACVLKRECHIRYYVLDVATALSLILISADLVFAFINHNFLVWLHLLSLLFFGLLWGVICLQVGLRYLKRFQDTKPKKRYTE